MRRAIDFLAPLGIVIIVGSIAWQRIGRTLPGKPEAYLIAGAALVAQNKRPDARRHLPFRAFLNGKMSQFCPVPDRRGLRGGF